MADNVAITPGSGATVAADDIGGGVLAQRVKPVWGPDGTGTDVDTPTPLPTATPDITATGNITTQNLVPAGVATAGSAVEITPAGRGSVAIQVTGTYTGALSIQGTLDGATWVTLALGTLLRSSTGAASNTIPSAAQDIFFLQINGYAKLRVTALAAETGTAAVTVRASTTPVTGALPSGSSSIGNVTLNSNAPNLTPSASGGGFPTTHHAISAASTNATSVKASAGTIGLIVVSNINAAARFFKLYNKASAPTVGTDTPVLTQLIPPGETVQIEIAQGMRLTTGIAYALTTGMAVADTGAVAATEHSVHISYV